MMEIVGTLSGVVVGAAVTAAVQHWREKQERKRIGYGMKKLFTRHRVTLKEIPRDGWRARRYPL